MTSQSEQAKINVTPLIDILLVLLIIFMVITPRTTHGLDTKLPQRGVASYQPIEQPIVLEIGHDHQLLLNSQPVSRSELRGELSRIYKNRPDKQLFIRADQGLEYEEVAHTIDEAQGSEHFLQVGLITKNN